MIVQVLLIQFAGEEVFMYSVSLLWKWSSRDFVSRIGRRSVLLTRLCWIVLMLLFISVVPVEAVLLSVIVR